MRNFNFPYFSRDIAEFWRRWHISLSTWFRDYLYIPLGGSRVSTLMNVRNTFVIFIVSGFWHGANWTFVAWGALNALYFLPLLLLKKTRIHTDTVAKGKVLPSVREFFFILRTFGLTVLAWIFFRADNMEHALNYISEILSPTLLTVPRFKGMQKALITIILVATFTLIEWKGREDQYALARLGLKWKFPSRYIMYYAIVIVIIWFGGQEQNFIYFQF